MIKRQLFDQLKKHLLEKEMTLIVGPRQAGKTTLMKILEDDLRKNGEKTLFLNLDIESDKQFFVSQSNLIKKIELEIGQNKGYVFLDEVQRKEDSGIFLKGIYDMGLPYKFIVSGSGSVELKEKIHESLAGRKMLFELGPLSFEEFTDYKTDYRYENNLTKFLALDGIKAKELLIEYLNFGGYPRVVLSQTREEKRKIIEEIFQSYIEKDISYLLKVQNTEAFINLVKLVASQIGNLVNYSEISSTLGLSTPTVKNYLWYLQRTFILEKITPFSKNIRKELTKAPVYYFNDFGLRNYAIGQVGAAIEDRTAGFLFENFTFKILKDQIKNNVKINFWRTKDGAEVDFVIDFGREIIPIEVKFQNLKTPAITRSFRSFINAYHPERAFVINLSLEQEIKLDKTKINFLPFWKIFQLF